MRKCKYCSTPITGRRQKEFCGLVCKNAYHRKFGKSKESQNAPDADAQTNTELVMQAHLKEIWENRQILARLYASGVRTLSGSQLLEAGYQPNYMSKQTETETACFDVSLAPNKDGLYEIILGL